MLSLDTSSRALAHLLGISPTSSKSEGKPITHTHPFNGPFSGTTRVSRYQKGKTNLDFTEARDSEWQWHQHCHMQVCTSLQTDNHASTPPLSFLQAGCPSCHPTNSIKALKASQSTKWNLCVSVYELIYSFSGPMRALGCNAPLIRFLTLELYIMFACLYSMIPHLYSKLFPTYLLPYLSFLLRIDPLRFQAGCRKRRLPVNQVLVFLCLFCVVIHFF